MDKLVQQNPEQFKPGKVETYQGEIVAKRYTFTKRLISIRSKERRLTEEQRAELAARFNREQQDGVSAEKSPVEWGAETLKVI